MPGSRMFIDPKMQVPVEDLIKGLIVQSGNDATVALAEGVGGTVEHFVELMNEQAKALGMKNTSYKNPEGLTEPGHTTTARDLSILATRLMRDFPEYVHYYAIKKYRYPGHAVDQRHQPQPAAVPRSDRRWPQDRPHRGGRLLHDRHRQARLPEPDGRPPPAGHRAGHGQRERARQRVAEAAELGLHRLRRASAVRRQPGRWSTPAVWKGKEKPSSWAGPRPIVVAVPAGTAAKIKTQVARPDPLVAPFTKGQPVGTLKVTLGDQPVAEVPLVALEPSSRPASWAAPGTPSGSGSSRRRASGYARSPWPGTACCILVGFSANSEGIHVFDQFLVVPRPAGVTS